MDSNADHAPLEVFGITRDDTCSDIQGTHINEQCLSQKVVQISLIA